MAHLSRRTRVVRLASILAVLGSIEPSHGSPGGVFDVEVPVLGGDAPIKRDIKDGDASVSTQTGSLSYSFPIEVPPGRLGIQPTISLTYSSQSPLVGGVAAGWTLELPEIRKDPTQSRLASTSSDFQPRFVSTLSGGHELIEVTEPKAGDAMEAYRGQYDGRYARFERLWAPGQRWRVRTSDGLTHEFGLPENMEQHVEYWRVPLSRTTDPFGNEVNYFWRTVVDGYDHVVDLYLDRIEYTTNPSHGLTSPHARVEFVYASIAQCHAGELPIGAKLEFDDFQKPRWSGSRQLTSIVTKVRNGATYRAVRTVTLGYDANAADCEEPHGPLRLLTSIQESATSPPPASLTTTMPAVKFYYGPLDRSALIYPNGTFAAPGGNFGDALAGGYVQGPLGLPRLEVMLVDIDGDGRVDRLRNAPLASGCGLRWERNVGNGFESQLQHPRIPLPTFRWGQLGAGADYATECSLAGQASNIANRENATTCNTGNQGVFLSYRFIDLNADGLPDLATALNVDGRYYSTNPVTGDPVPLPAPWNPVCEPGDGPMCPDLAAEDLIAPEICDGIEGYGCDLDETWIDQVLDSSPKTPCDLLMLGTSSPNNPTNPCPQKWRQPLERCGGYVWQVYWNQGAGSFAGSPETVVAPVPLDSNAADSSLGAKRGGFSSTLHAVMDIDGDGFIDAITLDSRRDPPRASNMWFVFRGDGSGQFRPRANGHAYIWQVPWMAWPSTSTAVFVPTSGEDGTSTINGSSMLVEATGDGAVDLLYRNTAPQAADDLTTLYRNKGRGFLTNSYVDTDRSQPEWLDVTSHSYVADAHKPAASPVVTQGNRRSLAMVLDVDGDGRLDFYDGRGGLDGGDVRYGDGSGELESWGNDLDTNFQIHGRLEGASGEFRQMSDFVDLTGDGVPEIVWSLGTGNGFQLAGDYPGSPVMRLMRQIDNGAGGTIEITYKSSTDPAIDMPGVDDEDGMPSHAWVVDTMTTRDASDSQPVATTTYRYGRPVWNSDQLGRYAFRGFMKTRTIRPLGAVIDSTFDYTVDWSGRLSESTTYASLTEASSDRPDTIETTTWEEFELFAGTVKSFQPTARKKWTCTTGQTRAQCQAAGGGNLQVDSTVYVAEAADGDPGGLALLHYPRHVWRKRGNAIQDGDRKFLSDHILYSGPDFYRLRIDFDQVFERVAGVDTMRRDVRHTWVANGSGPPGAFHQKTNSRPASGVNATELRYNETGTGLVTGRKKPTQFSTSSPARTTITFDASFPVFPVETRNEDDHVVRTDHDLGTGALLSTRGPNTVPCGGGCTEWEEVKTEIDGFGRPLRVYVTADDPDGTYRQELSQTFQYVDVAALPRKVTEDRVINFGQPETTRVETTFDGFGRIRIRKQHRFEVGLPDAIDTFTYDAQGNLAMLTTPDPSGDTAATVTYQYVHDPFDRPTRVERPGVTPPTYADTTEVTWEYSGLATTRRENAGGDGPEAETTTTTDVFDRLVRVDERIDGTTLAATTYAHDALDNVKAITDADGLVTTLDHDWRSRRTTITRGARVFRYEYDLNGNLVREIAPVPAGGDPLLYTTSIVFDDLDRPTSRLAGTRALTPSQLDTFGHSAITFTYDQNPNGVGRLTSASAAVVAHSFGYDARGNVETDQLGFALPTSVGTASSTRTISRTFNALGAVTSEKHGDDPVAPTETTTSYDRRGLPKQLTWQLMTPVVLGTAERNVARLLRNLSSSSVRQQWFRDRLGRITNTKASSLPSLVVRVNEDWSYYGMDDAETLVSFRGGLPQRTFNFSFDDRHQLTDADDDIDGYSSHFEYRSSGRLDRAVVASAGAPLAPPRDVDYLYATSADRDPEAIRQLQSNIGAAPILYTSDESGNIRTRDEDGTSGQEAYKFVYDGDDQQRRATAPNLDNELYYYDHTGQRVLAVSRLQNGTITKIRFWHASLEIEFAASGSVVETIAHVGLDVPVARIINRTIAKRAIHNHLGHFLAAFTPDGQALDAAFVYGPFGEILAQTGATDDYLRRFNGKEQDALTSLSYYGARYFDPLSLTWTQADPLYRFAPDAAWDEPRRANLYAFDLQNPLKYVDPDGKNPAQACAMNAACSEAAGEAAEIGVGLVTTIVAASSDSLSSVRRADALLTPRLPPPLVQQHIDPNAEPYEVSYAPPIGTGSAPSEDAIRTRTGEDFGGPMAPPAADLAKPKPGSAGGPGAGKRFSPKTRQEASGDKCVFCGKRTTGKNRQIDHAHPRSRGGNNTLKNAQNTCSTCNPMKGNKTTREFLRWLKSKI